MTGKRFDGSEILPGKYAFPGFWDEADKIECEGIPWERWEIALIGTEAGDMVCDEKDIDDVLSLAGYRLLLIPDNATDLTYKVRGVEAKTDKYYGSLEPSPTMVEYGL